MESTRALQREQVQRKKRKHSNPRNSGAVSYTHISDLANDIHLEPEHSAEPVDLLEISDSHCWSQRVGSQAVAADAVMYERNPDVIHK